MKWLALAHKLVKVKQTVFGKAKEVSKGAKEKVRPGKF